MRIHMVPLSGTRLSSIFEVFDVNVYIAFIWHLWPLYPRTTHIGDVRRHNFFHGSNLKIGARLSTRLVALVTTSAAHRRGSLQRVAEACRQNPPLSTAHPSVLPLLSRVMLRIGVALEISPQRCEFKISHELAWTF